MNISSAANFLGMLAALGIARWGLFVKQRSAMVGVIAAAVAFLAAGGARYASFVGIVAAVVIMTCLVQCFRYLRKLTDENTREPNE